MSTREALRDCRGLERAYRRAGRRRARARAGVSHPEIARLLRIARTALRAGR